MSLPSTYVKEFTCSVPTCLIHETVGAVLELFHRAQCDRVVVINSQQHPLGIVHLSGLLPHLFQIFHRGAVSQPSGYVSDATQHRTSDPWQMTLPDLGSEVILPLITLPQNWTLPQFLATMFPARREYAVVDSNYQFLGLLDRDHLLETLIAATCPTLDTTRSARAAPPSPLNPNALHLDNPIHADPPQIFSLAQQLLAQQAELVQRHRPNPKASPHIKQAPPASVSADVANAEAGWLPLSPGSNKMCSPALLTLLAQLLERLPLPLMLQTDTGKVLTQNLAWRQQINQLSDPIKIWHEAARCLGTPIAQSGSDRTISPPFCQMEFAFQPAAISSLPSLESVIATTTPCRSGSQPGSCVCVCTLKDGREQVIQLTKLSLDTLLPDLDLSLGSQLCEQSPGKQSPETVSSRLSSGTIAASTANLFQLATLTASPLDLVLQNKPAFALHATSETVEPAAVSARSLWLVMVQDVTQEQLLTQELTAKNVDLVQLNRLKDEFLACISHELKTPLTAVLGLSSLLKDQTLGELNQRQVHYAALIHQSSRHLMRVVNDILDLTRIETGQLELLYGAVDISTVCHRALEQAKQMRSLDSKKFPPEDEEIEPLFSLDVEPGLDSLIADELRLRQMLVHLLTNSLKFTEGDKPIGLKVSRWGNWIAFTIWDMGIGIPADKQHLIFQKFQQLENPLTRRFEGAGLGLVLTRRLARLHGGDATFLSKEGIGSQFTILLPPIPPDKAQLIRGSQLDDEPDTQDLITYANHCIPEYSRTADRAFDRVPVRSSQLRDHLVLIVEAVPQAVELLADQLTTLGYRLVVARSGTEALEKARRLQPSLIFLNPLLPLLSGWDVLTLLKSNPETHHIPIVVTASLIDEEVALHHQANGFLCVPVQSPKLQAVLRKLLPETNQPDTLFETAPLILIRLFPPNAQRSPMQPLLDLSELLRSRQYRILESDDLDQAELLAGVWKPNIILLEGAIADPNTYLCQLSQHLTLASLPIITFDSHMAQAANQVAGLRVFPYLLNDETSTQAATVQASTLLQVIQIAAECVWQPTC